MKSSIFFVLGLALAGCASVPMAPLTGPVETFDASDILTGPTKEGHFEVSETCVYWVDELGRSPAVFPQGSAVEDDRTIRLPTGEAVTTDGRKYLAVVEEFPALRVKNAACTGAPTYIAKIE